MKNIHAKVQVDINPQHTCTPVARLGTINPQHMCTPVARLGTIIPHLFGSLTINAIGGALYLGLKIELRETP